MIKSKLILAAGLIYLSLGCMAVPARRVKNTVTLSDGKTITLTLCGDEFSHYYESEDGRRFQLQDDGEFVAINHDESVSRIQRVRRQQVNDRRRSRQVAKRSPIEGEKRGLVILVNFSDKAMTYTQADYQDYFNKPGYSKYGMAGSVRDYFLDQSYGRLSIDFDVVGPVTVSNNMSYYGENDAQGNDKYPATMVIEALKLVNSSVDFSNYDWDGDGEVDQVYVIYAGYGENSSAPKNTIWPHEYFLSYAKYYGDGNGIQYMDGVKIDTYACSSELMGRNGNNIDGIGTACHEFSHCLGFPDFYDTSGKAFGMDAWDVMDYGCYGNEGYTPCGYTSYERMAAGWLTPIELTEYTAVKDMPALVDEPVAYIIYNKANNKEYFMLENRQLKSWDSSLYGHGMLVLHVDYDKSSWDDNSVNKTENRQRMTIVPADNSLNGKNSADGKGASYLAGDPWPGTKRNTSLTNTTTPAAKLYNNNSNGVKYLNYPLNEITEQNGLISFVGGSAPDAIIAPFTQAISKKTEYFNLSGRRIITPHKGIFITDGKKVIK